MGRTPVEMDHFRKQLRTERERRQWSQADVAKMLQDRGIRSTYPTTIAKVESGAREIKLDEAAALSELFEMPLDALLGRGAGAESDLSYLLRRLLDAARDCSLQLFSISNTLINKYRDVAALEFEGHEVVKADAERAQKALREAADALGRIAEFEPQGLPIALLNAVVDRAAHEKVLRLLKEARDETQP